MANKDKEAYRAYMREYMKERARRRMAEARERLGNKCSICGATEALEIDHIDRSTKSFTLAKGASFSEDRWQKELSKCQLLCQSCHQEKTARENGKKIAKGTHGTLSSFRYCKCEICKDAKRSWQREYNKRRRNSTGRIADF